MPNIIDEMKRKAQEYAEHAHAQIADLDKQLAELEKQKAEINTKIHKARGTLKRAANFPVKLGADYLCMFCWVDDDVTATLRPMDGTDRHDIFRCKVCQAESSF